MLIIVIVILDLYIFQAQKWGNNGRREDKGIYGGRKEPSHYVYFNAKKNNEIFIKILKLNKAAFEQLNYCKQMLDYSRIKVNCYKPWSLSYLYPDTTAWSNRRNLKRA